MQVDGERIYKRKKDKDKVSPPDLFFFPFNKCSVFRTKISTERNGMEREEVPNNVNTCY